MHIMLNQTHEGALPRSRILKDTLSKMETNAKTF